MKQKNKDFFDHKNKEVFMNKKGQAALEFLTTYGWAILVILIMVGALVYFGVANPSKALPDKCQVQTGFECRDYQITEDEINVILINRVGESIKDVDFASDPTSDSFIGSLNPGDCTVSSTVVGSDEQFNLTCANAGLFAQMGGKGDKVKVDFVLTYTPTRQTYPKTMSGTIYGPVR